MRFAAGVTTLLGSGRYLELVEENGWEYVRRPVAGGVGGVVVIVATTNRDELVLVEQPRIPLHCRTIELPAGLVGDLPSVRGEALLTAAARELEEETGFVAERWSQIVDVPSSVGSSAEVITLFRATGLSRRGEGGGDETEDITVHVVPLSDVDAFLDAKVAAGGMVDAKVYAGLYLLSREAQPGVRRR